MHRVINVYVSDRLYQVDIDSELVCAYVHRRYAWRWVRVSSERIKTAAILRASDAWHKGEAVAPQIDVPQQSRDALAAMGANKS